MNIFNRKSLKCTNNKILKKKNNKITKTPRADKRVKKKRNRENVILNSFVLHLNTLKVFKH